MTTRILELELAAEMQPVFFDKSHEHYRMLVRSRRQPLGWISFSGSRNEIIAPERIRDLVKEQVGTLVHHAMVRAINFDHHVQEAAISVVVCTRNRSAQLSDCLLRLLALQYDTFEIIVVDNAPDNDDTRQATAHLPVRYVREDRPGLDWARNRGIAEASYDIVAFTDDDVRVDPYWLQAINKVLADKEVSGVSGFVAPAEMETPAQHLFEMGYGGMGHGFYRRNYQKEHLSPKQLLWASSFGIGANMAFRKEIFERIGGFDTALDVGTPSHGGGDVEMFHRLVARGHLFVYEPSVLVWHHHRRQAAALKKQIFDNGRSFGCYLINCFRKKSVSRMAIIKFLLVDWLYKWNIKNLFRRRTIPASYTFREIWGMMTSPYAYAQTKKNDRAIRKKYS